MLRAASCRRQVSDFVRTFVVCIHIVYVRAGLWSEPIAVKHPREKNMRRFILTSAALALISTSASAAMVDRKIGYEIGGKAFEGVLVYDDSVTAKRPAILMEPDWSGVSPHAIAQAREVAGKDYVVFVADLFGVGYAPKDVKDRAIASGAVHGDINVARARGDKGLEVMLAEGGKLGIIDPAKVAGIGFCCSIRLG